MYTILDDFAFFRNFFGSFGACGGGFCCFWFSDLFGVANQVALRLGGFGGDSFAFEL